MPKQERERRGIQSVETGIRVLTTVAGMPGPKSLSNIAASTGMSLSQAHRYLSSLVSSGMLRQEASGVYALASGAIRIGLTALSHLDVFANADVHLKELAQRTRRTHLAAVWGDHGPVVVRWYPGSPAIHTSIAVGSTLPLLRSTTGQVFYTFGDREEMDRQARLLAETDPAGTPIDLDATREEIASNMYFSGKNSLGLRGVSAPVFDLQGRLALVVAQLASDMFPASEDGRACKALLGTCRALTESLGGHWPEKVPVDA